MTVKHLQTLQRQQLAVAVATDPNVLHKFKTGFNECAGEVSRYIGNMDGVETGVKQRLVAHLSNCVTGLQQPSPFSFSGANSISNSSNNIPISISQGNSNTSSSTTIPSVNFNGDINNNQNNTRIQVPAGIQLIPSRLPTGELALLVPNSSNIPFFSSSVINGSTVTTSSSTDINNQRSSSSAFTTVRPSNHGDSFKISSPPLSPASSSTSYDDHQVSESFHRPQTPSPKEVTVSFPTPPGSINHPSAFKPSASVNQEQSPPQQFQITSTSYSPETKEYGLKIEYKAVPIFQPTDKSNYKTYPTKSLEPLSVITSGSTKIKTPNKENYHYTESQNVHISRKRHYPHESTDGLLVVAKQDQQPSTSKYARFSFDSVSTTASSSSSSGSPDQRFSLENHFHQPSTSGFAGNNQGDTNNEPMWRPW